MKRSFLVVVLVLVFFSPSGVMVKGQGNQTVLQHFKISGSGAVANFNFVDGDIETFVFVEASADRIIEPPTQGGPIPNPVVSLFIVRSYISTGVPIIAAQGFTDDFSLTISKDMGTASLQATIPLTDQNNVTITGTVDMTWTATGDLIKEHTHEVDKQTGGFHINNMVHGDRRIADADGSVQALNTEFIDGPTSDAEIRNNTSGALLITTK